MTTIRNKMEKWFSSLARLIYHNRFKTLIIMAVLIAAIVSQLSKLTVDISTEGFLHKTDPTLIDYNTFRDQFGRDELIIVAIRSPEIFEATFLEKLKSLHEELEDTVPYIEDITSLINARNTRGEKDKLIVEDLLEHWPETDEELASVKQRALDNPLYKNLLISEDSTMTTIVIKTQAYSSAGSGIDVLEGFEEDEDTDFQITDMSNTKKYLTDEENSEVVLAVNTIADKYNDSAFEIYVAGLSVVTHFLKQSMIQDVRRFLSLCFITVTILLFIMFRRVSGVVLPLLIVIISLLSTLGLMALFNTPIKLPTQILPSFILAVSVGYSVHILSIFYQNLPRTNNKEEAIVYAIGHSGLAVVMTAATTAGGLFSFSTSEVAPIADVGIFAGTGVLIAMVYTIILLPAILAIIPVKIGEMRKSKQEGMLFDRLLAHIGRISTGHPYLILIISTGIVILSIVGIMKIHFSHDVLKWLPETNSSRIATETIDTDLRGSVNMEIIIDTETENGLYDPDILNRIESTAAYLEDLEENNVIAGKAWSLTTIIKETNRALHENQREFYTIPDNRNLIAQELLLFENSGSDDMEDFTDSQFSKARLMVKLPFLNIVAYTGFFKEVHDYLQEMYPDVKVTVTGMSALMFRTITNAIASMGKSYVYALVVVTILMIILIGRVRIGLLSMIPNLAPIIVTLGIMGWFAIPMNLFTMLVGNIAIGLAVDNTIHFMHNFRRYFEQSRDAQSAVMETLHTSGRAMLITSCVLSVGFFIFMFATMNNMIQFGFLTGLVIILALLADYFIAPALMVIVNRPRKQSVKRGGEL